MGAHDITGQVGFVERDLDHFGAVDRDAGSLLVDDDGNIVGVDDFDAGDAGVDDECEVLALVDDNRLELGVDLHDNALGVLHKDAVLHLQLSCLDVDVFSLVVADVQIDADHVFLLGLLYLSLWLRCFSFNI